MSDCFHPNPLVHGGSSQDQRMVDALRPETAPVDGRGTDELILFLEKYGQLLNYYDTTNVISGHWQAFIAQDLSTLLASISVTKYNDCLATYYEYHQKIQDGSVAAELKEQVKVLFDISFTLLDQVRRWNEKLVLKTPAKEMILREISGRLAFDLRELLHYYRLASPGHIDTAFILQPGTEDYIPLDTEDILTVGFGQVWWLKYNPADIINDWDDYINFYLPAHPTTKNVFSNNTLGVVDNIQYSSSYLRSVFTNVYNSYTRIINAVKKYFLESITTWPFHRAHNGLVLAFLKLFGVSQAEMNRLTDRHLNFYYKDVLRIERKPPVPDSAHLVLTLAKNVPPYILDAGSELLGGKDGTGKELIYKTTDSITVNNAALEELRSVFIDKNPGGGLFSAEKTNTLDGKGKDLDPADPSWFAFGSDQAALPDDGRSMTETQAGFLLAAPILLLSEGDRTITVEMSVSNFGGNSFTAGELGGRLDVYLTGKKDWIKVPLISSANLSSANAVRIDHSTNKITIKFTLDEKVGSIVAFDPEVHKATYDTRWPVIRCLFRKSANIALYQRLSSVNINSIHVSVKVKNAFSCIIHNDQGGLDPKNPFMPFGSRPKKNTSFYFGSHEVFSKKLTKLKLKLNWLGLPEGSTLYNYYKYKENNTDKNLVEIPDTASHSFTISASVKNGSDVSKTPSPAHLFNFFNNGTVSAAQDIEFNSLFSASESGLDPFTEYSPALRRGFLKINLTGPARAFGHQVFSTIYTQQVIGVNDDSSKYTLPNEPYTPLLQPLVYEYEANDTIPVGASSKKEKGQFFHLFPFGHSEKNKGSGIKFFYPFTHLGKAGAIIPLQGALHLGVKNIEASQVLTLYFEFLEGSEDASLDPPGLHWSYLANNEWKFLDDHILADSTNGFLGSGIVKLTIPADMNDDNTLMPGGMKWIRIAVPDLYRAYPKAYAVFTNAVKASFENRENETSHLAAPLKAGSISKLVSGVAEIKTVLQPYDSFDGRMQEQDKAYYTRVSERLRHKNRAITIWDYERLTLEQFSFLYKAKCLNHTNDVTETAPGCVRMIAVPDVSTKSTGNLFEPKISNNKRKKIKDYLGALNCPFADLQVQNPQFEAIKVKCEVRFREGLDVVAHLVKLKSDIDRFLAPWAFDESRGIDFGGGMHRSQIIYFMEKLPYVDFVTDFLMDLYINNVLSKFNVDEVKATTSRSILTSYRNHQIGTNVCAS